MKSINHVVGKFKPQVMLEVISQITNCDQFVAKLEKIHLIEIINIINIQLTVQDI